MELTKQYTTELMTGEIEQPVDNKYKSVWGSKVKTEDGEGTIVRLDPYADRDVLVVLKDGYSFWYNLDDVELIN